LSAAPSSAAFQSGPDALPAAAGAYVLAVELPHPLAIRLPGRPEVLLPAGRYLYCGSARGPGGLRARVGRHMRRGKAIRWHIDRLTEAGRVLGAWTVIGGDECALVAALAGFPVPIPGFGSSDCRHCPSHLLAWPAEKGPPFPLSQNGQGEQQGRHGDGDALAQELPGGDAHPVATQGHQP
jgi:Uri superfamily endonuclease